MITTLKNKKNKKGKKNLPSHIKEYKSMFGNYFFLLFSVSKNNFLFLRLKNLFGNPKWTEIKTVLKSQFVKETKNM